MKSHDYAVSLFVAKILGCIVMKYRHVTISRFGGPENLLLVEDDLPEPRANEVRAKVLTAGVSFADILMRQGIHPESWNLGRTPFTPGWDVVGVVDKLGDKVSTTWQIGQMVAALPIVGGDTYILHTCHQMSWCQSLLGLITLRL